MESIVEKPRYKSHNLHLRDHGVDHSDHAIMYLCERSEGTSVAAGVLQAEVSAP
jgi:hypothetical protein